MSYYATDENDIEGITEYMEYIVELDNHYCPYFVIHTI
jgi:uncharacterized protein YutD